MKPALLLPALAVALVSVSAGDETGCEAGPFGYHGRSAEDLRAIASACRDEQLASLYYNRAYHLDLLEDFRVLGTLISYGGADGRAHSEAYRALIALYEAFARTAWQQSGSEEVLAALNEGYEKAFAVAELRIRGQDILADRLASTQFD